MRTEHGCDLFGAIPRGSSHHGIPHADESPPPFVSFSLPYEGNAVILQTCTEKLPVFVNQLTACSYFSARHRSASLRTVCLLLSLLPPLILFHPLLVVSTHAYSLKLTPTCTHSHVHSVYLFIFFSFRCWISYCRCRVCYYFKRASLHGQHACTSHTVCIDLFLFFLSSWRSSSVGDFKITTHTSPTPLTEYTVSIPRLVSGSWDTSGGQSCSTTYYARSGSGYLRESEQRSRNERLLSFSGDQQLPHGVSCSRYQTINSKSGKMKIRQTKRGVLSFMDQQAGKNKAKKKELWQGLTEQAIINKALLSFVPRLSLNSIVPHENLKSRL